MLQGRRVLAIGSGKAGHEANALGVAQALGGDYELRRVEPRLVYARLAPYGPADPIDLKRFLTAPAPQIVIACGRATVPYARAIKRTLGRDVFAVMLQDPRVSRARFDMIWTPAHDLLRGANVMTTLTSPHPLSAQVLAQWRARPDPRLADLPAPRAAIMLGGPGGGATYSDADYARLREATAQISAQGFAIMATPSRRTPAAMAAAVRAGAANGFVWDGAGANPYGAMLALADVALVTGDSANMIGEATATGAPVYVFEAQARGAGKIGAMIDALERAGAVRRYRGVIERFHYAPIDSSAAIAAEIIRRMRLARR